MSHANFRVFVNGLAMFIAVSVAASGCRPTEREAYELRPETTQLSHELRSLVEKTLIERTGTRANPRLLGADDTLSDHLRLGADVFARLCQGCHGVTGDGNGPAAKYLDPRPRDYRSGIFKFTSTPYGMKPRQEDLVRTIRKGIYGTSMPSFALLPDEELRAVVDYVLALTHRGELEILLASTAEADEELAEETVDELADSILVQWENARSLAVDPLTPMPVEFSPEMIAAGKQAFLTKGCSKCHGEDGRGQTRENVGVDAWGQKTFAADLTSGMLHGGAGPLDIYRRISSGINGTPMPSFRDALSSEADTIWQLVSYVMHVSAQRRQGNYPEFAQVVPAAP